MVETAYSGGRISWRYAPTSACRHYLKGEQVNATVLPVWWLLLSGLLGPLLTAGLVGAVVIFGREWIAASAKEAARKGTELALADYRHEQSRELAMLRETHERSLTALSAANQKRLQEFGLLATKRHTLYPRVYGRYKIAADYYSSYVGAFLVPAAFDEWDKEQAMAYLNKESASPRFIMRVGQAYDEGKRDDVGTLLSEFYFELKRVSAERAFQRAKNSESLNELYLSDDVRAKLHLVRERMAHLSAVLQFPDKEMRRAEKPFAIGKEVQVRVVDLLHTMRAELHRGEIMLEEHANEGGSK
jgi:hypothetical protein